MKLQITTMPGITTMDSETLPVWLNQEAYLVQSEYLGMRGRIVPAHLRIGVAISGPLKPSVLQLALNGLITRQPILRAAFIPSDLSRAERTRIVTRWAVHGTPAAGLYRQYVRANAFVSLQECDICCADGMTQRRSIDVAIDEVCTRPFDYAEPPFIKALLFKMKIEEYLLVVVCPPLICDDVSVQLLIHDLRIIYRTMDNGSVTAVASLEDGYQTVASTEQNSFNAGHFDAALEYWREQWKIYEERQLTWLPMALPQSITTHSAASLVGRATLDAAPDEVREITRFSDDHGGDLFTVCVWAFSLFLQRITQKTQFPIWTNFPNRLKPSFAERVGLFANPHILGFDFRERKRPMCVLEEVRLTITEANKYQELPLAILWNEQGRHVERGIRIVLNCCNEIQTTDRATSGDVRMKYVHIPGERRRGVDCDVTVQMTETGLRWSVCYSTNMFRSASMRDLLVGYKHTLLKLVNSQSVSGC